MAVALVVSAGLISSRQMASVTVVPLQPIKSLMSWIRTPWALKMDTNACPSWPHPAPSRSIRCKAGRDRAG